MFKGQMAERDDYDTLKSRIKELEAALRKINALNDHPGRFNSEIQDVLNGVIDTSDIKFPIERW